MGHFKPAMYQLLMFKCSGFSTRV